LARTRFIDEITLDAAATAAGVSVRTVIRQFGGRDGLITAATDAANAQVQQRRDLTKAGDYAGAAEALLDDYEQWGDVLIKMLAQESREPLLKAPLDSGRRLHELWVRRVFAGPLASRRGRSRQVLLSELAAVTDVYLWQLLRRDRGLSRAETARALRHLMSSVAEAS
jgi:AcrR family transcriptional regulator